MGIIEGHRSDVVRSGVLLDRRMLVLVPPLPVKIGLWAWSWQARLACLTLGCHHTSAGKFVLGTDKVTRLSEDALAILIQGP